MASYYVYSGAGGAANGSSWANAYTTLTAAFSGHAAGDIYYVAHDHSESTAGALTLTTNGTVAAPTKILCVDRGGSVPPVAADRRATAQVATSVNNTINIGGYAHWDGLIFVAGNSTGAATINVCSTDQAWVRMDNCSLRIGSTGNGIIVLPQLTAALAELNNTTLSFAAVGQTVSCQGILRWKDTPSALLGTMPTILFAPAGSAGAAVECSGVDFSAAGSGKTLVGASTIALAQKFTFIDCKLNASVTKSAVPTAHGATEIDFIRCGSSGVNYNVFSHRISGTLNEETSVVRTGGASDGTTPIAWKIDTTANCTFSMPFSCPPIAIWNDDTSSAGVTATVEGIWGGGAVPNDDEVWVEVEYLDDASSPLGSFINDGKANLLTTAAGQASSSESWGGSTTKFKLGVTFTPAQAGWIYATVKVGKASSTAYIDPKVTLT